MDNLPKIFSLVFFLVFTIYIFFIIYVVKDNLKSGLHRAFVGICASLALWSMGFSFAINAPDLQTCLLWRRVAAFGWTIVFSIVLHYTLVRTENRLSKYKWIFPILYLPSLLIAYVYSLSPEVANEYNFIYTASGWVNVSVSKWDLVFNAYYGTYMSISVILIWLWGNKTRDKKQNSEARKILAAIVLALLLGTLTDLAANTLFKVQIPQIAPIIALLPIATVFYYIKRYGSMKPIFEEDMILNNATRAGIYSLIGILVIAGAILNLVSTYFYYGFKLNQSLAFSFGLFILGVFLQLIYHLRISDDNKDSILLFIVSILVIGITLHFIQSASISVWAFSFVFLIIFTLFQNPKMLIILSIYILATQILVWRLAPSIDVHVDGSDHIVRIALYGFAVWMAFYVNRVYRTKLQENIDQIHIQTLAADISAEFVAANMDNINEKISRALYKIGSYFQADNCYLMLIDLNESIITRTFEWSQEESPPAADILKDVLLGQFGWASGQILNNHIIHISNSDRIPYTASEEKKYIEEHGIQSLILIPIFSKGLIQGVLGLQSAKLIKKSSDERFAFLKIAANVITDALARVKVEQMQAYFAYYDQLTNLPNRTLFKQKAGQAIERLNDSGEMIGVMFLDLDSFKTVNDTMGHGGGDDLLINIAHKFTAQIRESDLVARFGGDEFLVLVDRVASTEDFIIIADEILSIFKQPFIVKGQEVFITASAGISVYPHDGDNVDILMKNADMAMYHAKDQGKNQYTFCTLEMKNSLFQTVEVTNSLYRALERNEFALHYQPQINIQANKIVGFEALLRWEHPELGTISPGIFVPLAERTGLINPIGEWVLRTACQQNKSWQDQGMKPVRMAVNLSFVQVRNPKLVGQVESILAETGLDPRYLELEITESVATKESNYIIDVFNNLKKLGVSLSIDDFGTEYSSLSRLKLLPVDRIKMDMQFVRGIDGTEKDRAIVKVIINLARNLGIPVIAEGVETHTQLKYLKQRLCDEVQGFYFFKPMPAAEVEAIIAKDLALAESQQLA